MRIHQIPSAGVGQGLEWEQMQAAVWNNDKAVVAARFRYRAQQYGVKPLCFLLRSAAGLQGRQIAHNEGLNLVAAG
jgi:hypothetical protein